MYFETWLDKKKKDDQINGDRWWLTEVQSMSEKELRSYLDLITLTCILLASKVNEQNM